MKRDYLVIDLEATCDNTRNIPPDEMETIEIGAVLVDGRKLKPRAEFQTFVRPVRHPKLTAFCTELTTITDAMLADAPSFAEAIDALAAFIGDAQPLFCSWGAYDRRQLRQDAAFHDIPLPLGNDHLNIKAAFGEAAGATKRGYGMALALKRAGIPLDGTHHRGIDDARNIAKLLPYALGKKKLPPGQPRR